MTTLTELLNDPEEHYPGNFDTPERANALLTGLCQEAAIEIERLNKAVANERVRFALECIDLVALYGGSVDLQAAIRARGQG